MEKKEDGTYGEHDVQRQKQDGRRVFYAKRHQERDSKDRVR